MVEIFNKFTRFNPAKDDPSEIPNSQGNYIIVLKPKSYLPDMGITINYKTFESKKIIYTGIASKSLRSRDFRQHFNGNAGRSTLRKSIGSLFGYKKIPRDKVNNNKTKFNDADEFRLTKWMFENLELYYYCNSQSKLLEDKLIKTLNPPLNLSKNKNVENLEFRQELSRLRNQKSPNFR